MLLPLTACDNPRQLLTSLCTKDPLQTGSTSRASCKVAKAALGGKDSKKKKKPEKSPVNFLQDKDVKESAWQRKEGKNPSGGLNEKGRKSYERENPGSDLKAPQPEGGPRKRSFCARMGGMKGPMKDDKGKPTRKALALRKWKC